MSIEKVKRKGGDVWRVRWYEGGRHPSRVLGRKRDAEAFDAEVRRRQRIGELRSLDGGKQTLSDFAREWWRVYAELNLSRNTLAGYAASWDRHVLPRLGGFALREITSEVVQGFAADLKRAGVGPAAIRRTLMILSSVLQHAEDWGRIAANPVRRVKKPSAKRTRAVRPLPPAVVERLRQRLLWDGRRRDAALVSVLAYAGPRPGEALALTWDHVRDRTLLVEQSNDEGRIKATKTGRTRTVRLLDPLAADLAEWRLACGRPGGRTLVFPNGAGEPWNGDGYRNWRRRVYQPIADELGCSRRPYDLRHSFASLLIWEGASVVEVARQLGHAPSMTLGTYAHVFEEFDGAERVSAETQIRLARDELVPVLYPRRAPAEGA